MTSTTFTYPPASLHDQDHTSTHHSDQHRPSTGSIDSTHLSPVLSRVNSESLSPSINHLETPAGSNYHSSDFSDIEEDPFFGADFNTVEGGGPIFLDEHHIGLEPSLFPLDTPSTESAQSNNDEVSTYPMTPEHTASIHTTSPRSETRGALKLSITSQVTASISPQELQKPFTSDPILPQPSQLTPSQSSSCRSSEDGLAPTRVPMQAQSPRVTVSFWKDKESESMIHAAERSFEDSPTTVRGGFQSAGDLITANGNVHSAPRDSMGIWQPDPSTGQAGLGPESRSSGEVNSSINEMAARREVNGRNEAVGEWLSNEMNDLSIHPKDVSRDVIKQAEQQRESNDRVPLGNETRNQAQPGQTYLSDSGGPLTQEDRDLLVSNRNWADAPMDRSIRSGPARHQPETSQAAIERFERMCRDTDSVFSRAATWGTRRRSLPSIMDVEIDGGTLSGNIFKKLSISRPDRGGDRGNKQGSQQSSLLRDLRGLIRRPSASSLLKRARETNDEDSNPGSDSRGSQDSKRESVSLLAPPNRMGSWGKKPMPSINTALGMMGQNAASIGTTHSRSGSISATPVTSPKSPFGGLSVKSPLRRPRSKSDLPKGASAIQKESHLNLVGLWRQNGGPPVANLAKPSANNHAEADDDDDDDDDFADDLALKGNANDIDNIKPDLAGFQQHVLNLNPGLATTNTYLVDRIAHQQLTRYKHLLKAKVNHMGLGANCPSGAFCIALGGSASTMDPNGDTRELDPLSAADDEDGAPSEGKISHESFPQDIPMPPTSRLPAEFECQLCYQSKKFQKPSDWTKHVHEDVQPFTCTWDKCREPKIFKRKADWVRHENEGHRHLEWWTCDVEGCHHQCFRRDNFLQHLVREHKFAEPKIKTKAAIKKAGGGDPTWVKVEQCHIETTARPQDEPCRFCGKAFPTWKKLTVHLAKHMEAISLPVLRLVAVKAKELSADTIISPVQDPPPRPMIPTPVRTTAPMVQFPTPVSHGHQMSPNNPQGPFPQQPLVYPVMPPETYQTGYFPSTYDTISHNLQPTHMVQPMGPNYNPAGAMPVTTASFGPTPGQYIPVQNNGMDQFSSMNGLGLQNTNVPMGPMDYNGIVDQSSSHASPFSGHGSMSPYTHSPNQNAHNGENLWGGVEKRLY